MANLTDGELFKKTLRTTLVMLGSTALWLGVLTGAVLVSTGSSTSGAAESKVDKPASTTPAAVPAGQSPRGPGVNPSPRSIHQRPQKLEAPHPGDPI